MDDNLKKIWKELKKNNPKLVDYPQFKIDMSNDDNLESLRLGLKEHNPGLPDLGQFKFDMGLSGFVADPKKKEEPTVTAPWIQDLQDYPGASAVTSGLKSYPESSEEQKDQPKSIEEIDAEMAELNQSITWKSTKQEQQAAMEQLGGLQKQKEDITTKQFVEFSTPKIAEIIDKNPEAFLDPDMQDGIREQIKEQNPDVRNYDINTALNTYLYNNERDWYYDQGYTAMTAQPIGAGAIDEQARKTVVAKNAEAGSYNFLNEDDKLAAESITDLEAEYAKGEDADAEVISGLRKNLESLGWDADTEWMDIKTGMIKVKDDATEDDVAHAVRVNGVMKTMLETTTDRDKIKSLNEKNYVIWKYLEKRLALSDVANPDQSMIGQVSNEKKGLLLQKTRDAKDLYEASSRLLLLNQEPGAEEKTVGEKVKEVFKPFVTEMLGSRVGETLGSTVAERNVAIEKLSAMEPDTLPLTEKQQEDVKATLSDELRAGWGNIIAVGAKFAILGHVGKVVGIPKAIAAIGKEAKNGWIIKPFLEAAYMDAQFQIGFGAEVGEGAAFDVAMKGLGKIPMPWGAKLNTAFRALSTLVKTSTALTAAGDITEAKNAFVQAATTDATFKESITDHFGTLSEYGHQTAVDLMTNIGFGIMPAIKAGMTSPAKMRKQIAEIQKEVEGNIKAEEALKEMTTAIDAAEAEMGKMAKVKEVKQEALVEKEGGKELENNIRIARDVGLFIGKPTTKDPPRLELSEDGDAIIGRAVTKDGDVAKITATKKDENNYEIATAVVSPEYQRKGLGTELIDLIKEKVELGGGKITFAPKGERTPSGDAFVNAIKKAKKPIIKEEETSAAVAEISPNKEVKANIKLAVSEITDLPRFDMKQGPAEFVFNNLKKKGFIKDPPAEGMVSALVKSAEEADLIEWNNDKGVWEPTEYGQEFVNAVSARLQTRKGVKAGTDLFPEAANIPEFKGSKVKETKVPAQDAVAAEKAGIPKKPKETIADRYKDVIDKEDIPTVNKYSQEHVEKVLVDEAMQNLGFKNKNDATAYINWLRKTNKTQEDTDIGDPGIHLDVLRESSNIIETINGNAHLHPAIIAGKSVESTIKLLKERLEKSEWGEAKEDIEHRLDLLDTYGESIKDYVENATKAEKDVIDVEPKKEEAPKVIETERPIKTKEEAEKSGITEREIPKKKTHKTEEAEPVADKDKVGVKETPTELTPEQQLERDVFDYINQDPEGIKAFKVQRAFNLGYEKAIKLWDKYYESKTKDQSNKDIKLALKDKEPKTEGRVTTDQYEAERKRAKEDFDMEMEVVTEEAKLPETAQKALAKVREKAGDPDLVSAAMWDPVSKKMFVVDSETKSVDQLRRNVFHEAFHKGEDAAINPKKAPKMLQWVYDAIPDKTPEQKAKKADLHRKYGAKIEDVAFEYMSKIAEGDPKTTKLQEYVSQFRQFLRDIGIDMKMTDTDIVNIIKKAHKATKETGEVTAEPTGEAKKPEIKFSIEDKKKLSKEITDEHIRELIRSKRANFTKDQIADVILKHTGDKITRAEINDLYEFVVASERADKKVQKDIDIEVEGKAKGERTMINDWVELKRSLTERGLASRKGYAQAKKDLAEQSNELLGFIKENRDELSKLEKLAIPSLMKALTEKKLTDASINNVKRRLTEAINRQQVRDTKRDADKLVKDIKGLKTEKTEGGIPRGKLVLQNGVDYKDNVLEAAERSMASKNKRYGEIEELIKKTREALEDPFIEKKDVIEFEKELDALEFENGLLDTFSGLRDRSRADVQNARDIFEGKFAEYHAEFKAVEAAKKAQRDKLAGRFADQLHGTPKRKTLLSGLGGKAINYLKLEKQQKGFRRTFHTALGTISSLAHKADQAWRTGIEHVKSELKAQVNNLRKGDSRSLAVRAWLNDMVERKVKDTFGGPTGFRKAMKKQIDIELTINKFNEAGEKEPITPLHKLQMGQLAHIWASWYSRSNRKYIDRLGITEKEIEAIDKILPDNIKDFAEWTINEYFGQTYDMVNEIYRRNTGRDLPKLEDYLPVNASTWKMSPQQIDLSNIGIWKSFTKARRFGDYDLTKNNIYDAVFKHMDATATFIGLAEPIAEFQRVLNSRPVLSAFKRTGNMHVKEALIHLMDLGYTQGGNQAADQRLLNTGTINRLRRNFVKSKILMNLNLFPKQVTSFIAALDGDYGDPAGIIKEMGALTTNRQARKLVFDMLKNSPQFKYRNIVDIESLSQKGMQVHPEMFGKSRMAKAAGLLTTLAWNPTAVGDKFTIGLAGLPLMSHNYKRALKDNLADGMSPKDAKLAAGEQALQTFESFMNETQQSKRFTDVSLVQQGGWRNATFFMNAVMAYSRKVYRKQRDISRGFVQKKYELKEKHPNMNSMQANLLAMQGIKPRDAAGLFIYANLLPVLFRTVQAGGANWAEMWSDDKETKRKAMWDMGFDILLGWTKGLLGVGFALEFGKNALTKNTYGRTSDNFVRTFDDTFETIEAVGQLAWHAIEGKPNPFGYDVLKDTDPAIMSQKDRDQLKQWNAKTEEWYQKYQDLIFKAPNQLSGVVLGTPTTMARRMYQAATSDDYDTGVKKLARIYGLPKQSIQYWFADIRERNKRALDQMYADGRSINYVMGWMIDQAEGDQKEKEYLHKQIRKKFQAKLQDEITEEFKK